MDVARHTVAFTKLIRPEPGKLMAPFAEGVEDFTPGRFECMRHTKEALLYGKGVGLEAATVVVFEVVDTPVSVSLSVEFLITVAPGAEAAVEDSCVAKEEVLVSTPCSLLKPWREQKTKRVRVLYL